MYTYNHRVQYYETDRMGITHHSNYIRWMEEARISFLDQIGWNYARLEEEGVISPVTSVTCQYKAPTTFNDEVEIQVSTEECRGVRLILSYTMRRRSDQTLVCTARSEHCFTDADGKLLNLRKSRPDFYEALLSTC